MRLSIGIKETLLYNSLNGEREDQRKARWDWNRICPTDVLMANMGGQFCCEEVVKEVREGLDSEGDG